MALKTSEEAVKRLPDASELYDTLAYLCWKAREYEKAAGAYRQYSQRAPQAWQRERAVLNVAEVYEDAGKPEKALAYLLVAKDQVRGEWITKELTRRIAQLQGDKDDANPQAPAVPDAGETHSPRAPTSPVSILPASTTPSEVSVVARLAGGEQIEGLMVRQTIIIRSGGDDIIIPTGQIKQVTFGQAADHDELAFTDGDRLTGSVDLAQFDLMTHSGKISLAGRAVKTITRTP